MTNLHENIPTALILGPIREIAFGWQMIDCGFGVLGMVIFGLVRRAIVELRGLGACWVAAAAGHEPEARRAGDGGRLLAAHC